MLHIVGLAFLSVGMAVTFSFRIALFLREKQLEQAGAPKDPARPVGDTRLRWLGLYWPPGSRFQDAKARGYSEGGWLGFGLALAGMVLLIIASNLD